MSSSQFRHEVAFYGGSDGYAEATVPFLREGLEREDAIMVAVGPEKASLLRGELGADAEGIRFEDIEALGRNPARIIPLWREFADQHSAGGGFRGIGEPIWPGRDEEQIEECHRHESLLNVAFGAGTPWSLLCPYDSSALSDQVLETALHTHPSVADGNGGAPSPQWRDEEHPDPFTGDPGSRPGSTAEFRYAMADLHDLRAFAARVAAAAGLSDERAEDLILAASELAANSIVHGGGSGHAHAWSERGAVYFETNDRGRIEDPLVGRVRPDPTQPKGRGLWIANQLCDLVQIRSSEAGTAVRLRLALD